MHGQAETHYHIPIHFWQGDNDMALITYNKNKFLFKYCSLVCFWVLLSLSIIHLVITINILWFKSIYVCDLETVT